MLPKRVRKTEDRPIDSITSSSPIRLKSLIYGRLKRAWNE